MAAMVKEARMIASREVSGTVPASPASPISLPRLSDLHQISLGDLDMQELFNLPSMGEVPERVYSVSAVYGGVGSQCDGIEDASGIVHNFWHSFCRAHCYWDACATLTLILACELALPRSKDSAFLLCVLPMNFNRDVCTSSVQKHA